MGRKFERCVRAVKKQGGKYNPYAVCTKSVGRLNARQRLELLGGMKVKQNDKKGVFMYKTLYQDKSGKLVKKYEVTSDKSSRLGGYFSKRSLADKNYKKLVRMR